MTLNSEGLEKALEKAEQQAARHGDNVTCSSLNIGYDEVRMILSAARSHLSALPPVDGLEVVGHVKPEHPGAVEPLFVRELSQPWMEGIFTIPVVTLSQASSVIAGLKEEKTYWWEKAHEENGLRVHLEEENKRLKEALEKIAQEKIQTNFGPWPTKGSEIARQAMEDHNG